MKKKIALVFLVILISLCCEAGEFWMLSSKTKYALNDEMLIAFLEGDNFSGEPWDLKKHKIEKLDLHRRSGVTDLKKLVQPASKIKLRYKLTEEGTQILTLQSDYSYGQIEAGKFNTYLKEYGLDDALQQRNSSPAEVNPAREFTGRFVKLLIQVGDKTDDTFKKKTGLRVEIVPLQNPFTLHPGDHLDCLVLVDGKPSPHQLVKVWNKIGRNSFLQDIYTENDGTLRFPINARGRWMVSTVKMIPSEKPNADWQSMWSSLVFGI
jgi:uncharacterized GH25 family protein